MTEEDAFLQTIAADPEDGTSRLVYADWLEEYGDPRAAFVRISRGIPRFRAILSDVHGNLEALQAVLAAIAALNVREVYCLGDSVAFGGPNPCECLDLLTSCRVVLLGNIDQAVVVPPDGFGPTAERAVTWARAQLNANADFPRYREFLSRLPRSHEEGEFLFVHGTPRNPLNEYFYPEDIYIQRKMEANFGLLKRYCFQGHTHVPGIFTEPAPDDVYHYHSPEEVDHRYHLDGQKTFCNVGSVGQPRDGDWRASYVLLVGHTIHFRRVAYDVETTVQKIHAIPELANFLGDRLREGR